MKESWLRCTITPGQFTGEYAVEGQMYNNVGFSLFASEDDLECDKLPEGRERVTGWLRVDVLEQQGNLILVRLPQQTLENGNTVTVDSSNVQVRRARQEA